MKCNWLINTWTLFVVFKERKWRFFLSPYLRVSKEQILVILMILWINVPFFGLNLKIDDSNESLPIIWFDCFRFIRFNAGNVTSIELRTQNALNYLPWDCTFINEVLCMENEFIIFTEFDQLTSNSILFIYSNLINSLIFIDIHCLV